MKLVAVVGAAALAFLSSMSARAADLPGIRPAIPAAPGYIPARYLWTGFYLGAAAGGGWGKSTFYDPFGGVTDTVSVTGFLVGGGGLLGGLVSGNAQVGIDLNEAKGGIAYKF